MEFQQANNLEDVQVKWMECSSGESWVNLWGFFQGISQVETLENLKESPNEDFLDFFTCTVLCGALVGLTAGNSGGELVGQFVGKLDGML